MTESFREHPRRGPDTPDTTRPPSAADWDRLEEIGDLHYHASAYSTALDYYSRLTTPAVLNALSRDRAVLLLRKVTDANINLGQLDAAAACIEVAEAVVTRTTVLTDPTEAAIIRARFQLRQAIVIREQGRLHDALNLAKRVFSVLALTDEHADVARAQVGMGICYVRLGRLEKAEELFNDGLATFRRIGNELGVANLLMNLALLQVIRCRWDRGLAQMEKALELTQRIGATHVLPMQYLNQGILLQKIDRLGESRAVLEKGLRLATSLGDRLNQCRLYLASGRLEILDGRLARAEELVLAGKTLAEQNRFLREATIADEYLGDILLARGEHEKALFNYQLGLEKSRTIAAGNDLEGELKRRVGEVHLAAGRLDEAVAACQSSLTICEQCGEIYEIGFAHLTLGQAFARLGDDERSAHHFRESIETYHAQRLSHLWCRAILSYTEHRLAGADEPELLLLRRYLLDAQENGASSVSDRMLCQVLEKLARVQIRLSQFDDALLTVFELERHAVGCQDSDLDVAVVRLRKRIEAGLLGGVQVEETHLRAISGLPGLFSRQDASVPRNLDAVLDAGADKVQADTGFIAMADGEGDMLRCVTRRGMTENLAAQLTHWFENELVAGRRDGTCLFSRLGPQDDIVKSVPALMTVADSCVFLPIALHGRRFGLLYLGKSGSGATASAFDRASLDFLTTYMGFLALFLYEKNRGADGGTAATPFENIESFENIITQNAKMLEVLGLARKVAPSDLTVLLNGETGTGKGLLAYSIHALSKRADRRFMSINCAAIPETLLESELFGHKRGSFTGAHSDKKGLLAEAEGGTVFLDEIGKMPLSMQGKLLHFMDTKVVRPVGSNQEFAVDVRIVCASKSDLHQMAMAGLFLEDLYYRLLDFPLVIPPLRERPDDIDLLAQHFVVRFSAEQDVPTPTLDQRFRDHLQVHAWPGNVRELEKSLQRAIVLAHGVPVLRPEHLPPEIAGSAALAQETDTVAPLKETLAEVECREIRRALVRSKGNKSQAARDLQISYPNLLKKVRHYGIKVS